MEHINCESGVIPMDLKSVSYRVRLGIQHIQKAQGLVTPVSV